MKLEERIHNIKTLLHYCHQSSNDLMIRDEVCEKFFAKFFKKDSRFRDPVWEDHTTVRISLSTHYSLKTKEFKEVIHLGYCYEYDREGQDWESCWFDDPEVVRNGDWDIPKTLIQYSEIPDHIWKRIQDSLYEDARIAQNEAVESYKRALMNSRNMKAEFENLELYK